MNPKVSILVPIYNTSKFIEKCAISLFEQTFEDIEYIFVNDCTPDNSIEILNSILDKYPHRKEQVKIIHHPYNKGSAGARNTGVANATGDFILQIDSDDYIELNMLELLYNEAINCNADIVVCDYKLEWEKVSKVINTNYPENKDKFIEGLLRTEIQPYFWNKLIRRSLYVDNNITAQEGVDFTEDFSVVPILVYYANKISKINANLYHYIQNNSQSYTKSNNKSIYGFIGSRKIVSKFFEEKKEYQHALLVGKLKTKIFMLEMVNSDERMYINSLFPEIDDLNIKDINLSIKQNILFFLAKNKLYYLLDLYIKSYKALFKIVQKLKGR